MHAGRTGGDRLASAADGGEVLIGNAHERGPLRRRFIVLRDDQRDAIAEVAHDAVAQHRLIALDQAVAVHRNVRGGQHAHDARHG